MDYHKLLFWRDSRRRFFIVDMLVVRQKHPVIIRKDSPIYPNIFASGHELQDSGFSV